MSAAAVIARPRPVHGAGVRPQRMRVRWALRLAWSVPFLVSGVLVRLSATLGPADRLLAERARLIHWGSADLSWMGDVFPPLPAGIVAPLGERPWAFGLIGALAVGFALEQLGTTLRHWGVGVRLRVAVLAALAVTPPLHILVANDLERVLALVLLVVALDGVASFAARGSTEAGLRAGLALGLGVLTAPGAWVCTAAVVVAVQPTIRAHGWHARRLASATVVVLGFPTAAALAWWAYVAWWFHADPWAPLRTAAPDGAPSVAAAVAAGALVATPLLALAVVRGVRIGPLALVAPIIVLVGLLATLTYDASFAAGGAYVVVTVVALLLLAPELAGCRCDRAVGVATLVQVALGWGAVIVPTAIGGWTVPLFGF